MFHIGSHVVLLKFALPHDDGAGASDCSRGGGSDTACDRGRGRHGTARHGTPADHQPPPTAIPTGGRPAPPRYLLSPTRPPLISSHFVPPVHPTARRAPVLRPKLDAAAAAAAVCRNEAGRATDGRTDGRPAVVAHRPAVPRLSARFAADRRRLAPGDGCHLFIYDRQTDRAGSCPPAQLAG